MNFDSWSQGFKELFVSSRERARRRQCEFHLKVARPLRDDALRYDEGLFKEYFDELTRAVAARPETLEPHWRRCEAGQHWFDNFNPKRTDPATREMARIWNDDITFVLTHFPDESPPWFDRQAARAMRGNFERLCRGIKVE